MCVSSDNSLLSVRAPFQGLDGLWGSGWGVRVPGQSRETSQWLFVCRFQTYPLCPVFGSKQSCAHSSGAESRLPTALPWVPWPFNQPRGLIFPVVDPRAGVFKMCGLKHSPCRTGCCPCNRLPLRVPSATWSLLSPSYQVMRGFFLLPRVYESYASLPSVFSETCSTCMLDVTVFILEYSWLTMW